MNQDKKVALFTKTKWNEPPRIRHQVARLLRDNGHQVIFFEKHHYKFWSQYQYHLEDITFHNIPELFHHQFRPFKWMVNLNYKFLSDKIIKLGLVNNIDLIVNFNYDYGFLRKLFPETKIITIINDDFEIMARPWMKRNASLQLRETCEGSDVTLAVSFPLLEKLNLISDNASLFLPWADDEYRSPKKNMKRNVVLYWGFIDKLMQWDLLEDLLYSGVRIRFVGPIAGNCKKKMESFRNYEGFEYFPACQLQDLNLDDVSCSILPYSMCEWNFSITVNNRAFRLLSHGIPLVYTALPSLIKTEIDVIYPCRNFDEFKYAISFFENRFYDVQTSIREFLEQNYSDARYEQLKRYMY